MIIYLFFGNKTVHTYKRYIIKGSTKLKTPDSESTDSDLTALRVTVGALRLGTGNLSSTYPLSRFPEFITPCSPHHCVDAAFQRLIICSTCGLCFSAIFIQQVNCQSFSPSLSATAFATRSPLIPFILHLITQQGVQRSSPLNIVLCQ